MLAAAAKCLLVLTARSSESATTCIAFTYDGKTVLGSVLKIEIIHTYFTFLRSKFISFLFHFNLRWVDPKRFIDFSSTFLLIQSYREYSKICKKRPAHRFIGLLFVIWNMNSNQPRSNPLMRFELLVIYQNASFLTISLVLIGSI